MTAVNQLITLGADGGERRVIIKIEIKQPVVESNVLQTASERGFGKEIISDRNFIVNSSEVRRG